MSRGPIAMDWAALIASSPVDFMKKLVLPWRWERNIRSSNSRVSSMARRPWRSVSGSKLRCPRPDGAALLIQDTDQAIGHLPELLGGGIRARAGCRASRRNDQMAEIRRLPRARRRFGNMKV